MWEVRRDIDGTYIVSIDGGEKEGWIGCTVAGYDGVLAG